LATRYRDQLADIAGIRVQIIETDDESTWKDFTIAVDAAEFGCTRDELTSTLRAEGIDTRCYFDPPVHRQQSHAASADRPLPTTDRVASQVISLPLYPALEADDLDRVVAVIADAGRDASTRPAP
jgi:dTDP-4-amino-4,6-dideoxygalactose transaminase